MEEREVARPGRTGVNAGGAPAPRRRIRSFAVACTILAVVGGLALPVVATWLLAVEDPDDTPGLLDVHEVRFRDARGEPPAWTVITFHDWTPRAIWDRGYVLLYLDTLGSPDSDYYAMVRADRRGLVGSIWRDRDAAPDVRLFDVPVRKRGGDGVEVDVPLRRLNVGSHRTLYRWSVRTLFTGGSCHRTCVDPAPDATMIEQPLPTSSPT